MYLRFVILAPSRRPATGLFRARYHPQDDPFLPEWLRAPINEHYAWFAEHLPVPRRFTVVSKRRRIYVGLCWFRPEAREHIARARDLARLIAEAGHPTAALKTRHLGQILYRDEFQIVAKPEVRTRLAA